MEAKSRRSTIPNFYLYNTIQIKAVTSLDFPRILVFKNHRLE